jgi:hypothetical protein
MAILDVDSPACLQVGGPNDAQGFATVNPVLGQELQQALLELEIPLERRILGEALSLLQQRHQLRLRLPVPL